jgi:hypothetical protein
MLLSCIQHLFLYRSHLIRMTLYVVFRLGHCINRILLLCSALEYFPCTPLEVSSHDWCKFHWSSVFFYRSSCSAVFTTQAAPLMVKPLILVGRRLWDGWSQRCQLCSYLLVQFSDSCSSLRNKVWSRYFIFKCSSHSCMNLTVPHPCVHPFICLCACRNSDEDKYIWMRIYLDGSL